MRFPDYFDKYVNTSLSLVLSRVSNPVKIDLATEYYQIGIRSHGKGLFYKDKETGKEIGNKRIFWIEPDCLIVNIVFAWERAVAKTTNKETGMVASHRFPMYKVKNSSLDYLLYYLKTDKGKELLELSSPGGAGRNKTLNQLEFLNSKLYLPSIEEQNRIAHFLTIIDERIELQNKIIEHKISQMNYIMDEIFSNCNEFVELEELISYGRAGGTPKSSEREYYGGNIPFLSISDISMQGKYIVKTNKYLTEKGLNNSSAWLVPKNSLILSMYASVGFPTINRIPLATSQAMFSMILKNESDIDFLYYYLLFFQRKKLNKIMETGTQSNINADTVKHIPIPNLDLNYKTNVIKTLNKLYDDIEIEKDILSKLKTQKEYLLRNLFI